jgi:hypothetical protein
MRALLALFIPEIFKSPQVTIGMHDAPLGCWQLMVEELTVATPEHVGHRIEVSNHIAEN